jgi:carboxyl-terminal processing protease
MDQPDATMPALTGDRDSDWNAFAAVYQKVTGQLPASPAQRQELAGSWPAAGRRHHDRHDRQPG